MGEKMNRISTTWLTLGCVASIFALGTACSSGGSGDDGGTSGKGTTTGTAGNSTGTGGNTGTAGNGVIPIAGTATGTAGTATGTAGRSTGTAGTGTGGTGSAAPSVCDGAATHPLPIGEAYIDNFETTTRFESWYSFSDTTPPNMPKPERVPMGALATGFSGHVTATGIKSSKAMGYGAGFGFGLVDPALFKCVDLTAFDGISFWAKGTAGADNTLKFQIVSPLTQPSDSDPVGDCKPMTACAFAHPAKVITLKADW